MTELVLPRPLPHQLEPMLADARFKMWNWGRRAGKSRGSYAAAVVGHGPGSTWGPGHDPKYPGIMHGVDVIWVARDYPQALTIWQEEVLPRFKGRDKVKINEQTRQVRVEGCGMLEVRSAEAIDGIRGRGGRLGGLILDEAAHWHLEYAWRSVLLPALLDNNGWAIFNSSPNADLDGNPEHRVPSYFNILCQEVLDGKREGWDYTHRTARDNSAITPESFAALVAEYPPDSPQLAQEVDAKLLVSGAGLAFPEFDPVHHVARAIGPITQYRWFAGMDWGYRNPGCFLLMAAGTDRELVVRWEYYFREQTGYQAGEAIGAALLSRSDLQIPEYVACDEAMWGVTNGAPIAEDVLRGLRAVLMDRAPALVPAPKGPGSRVAGWNLVHEALRFDRLNIQKDGTLAPYHRPRLRVHPDCPNLLRTLPVLPRDARNSEDVATEAEDHAADALRYALVLRTPELHEEQWTARAQDRHGGWHRDGTPRRPNVPGYDDEHERDLAVAEGRGFRTGMRWSE